MSTDPSPILDAQSFLDANEAWAREFHQGHLEAAPRRRMAILTCMDSRYNVQGALGIALGDAHTIRNAGGRATDDAIRSLVLSAHALGTRGCVVIHHTKCGLYNTTNEEIRARVKAATGADTSHIDFRPFHDVEQSVHEDLEILRACPLLPQGYELLGFVYDVENGRLSPVA